MDTLIALNIMEKTLYSSLEKKYKIICWLSSAGPRDVFLIRVGTRTSLRIDSLRMFRPKNNLL